MTWFDCRTLLLFWQLAKNWDKDTEDGKDVLVYSFLGAGLFIIFAFSESSNLQNKLSQIKNLSNNF